MVERKCDATVSAGSYITSVPMVQKIAAIRRVKNEESSYVLCRDGISECPIGTTCCLLEPGLYGCCPMLKVSSDCCIIL